MSDVPAWYTRAMLAERWVVSRNTVSNWLTRARRHGFPPKPGQYRRKYRRGGGCIVLIRSDYANALFVWILQHPVKRNQTTPLKFTPKAPSEVVD